MPLMGAQGPGSNISWRGNLDEYPDFFGFSDNLNQMPGIAVTSNSQTITGINYKALVTAVGSGCSVSVNGGEYRNGNDSNNPIIIRNNDVVRLQLRTAQNGDRFDFNRSYNVNVKIGKRDASWLVKTRELDDDPIPFIFNDSLNNEVSVGRTSNEVQVLDIDNIIGVDALVTTPTGNLYINGVNVGTSGKVFDGDFIYLENTSSGFYNTNVVTTITLGTYTTSYNIRTRVADATVNAFVFNPLTNVNINSIHDSNTITLSGADPNVNGNNLLPTSITGGQFRVERNSVIVRDFSREPFQTQNGDQITVRIVASSRFLTTETATLNVNGVLGSFQVTTRPTPVKTFPSPFNFLDRTGVERTATLTPPENRIDSDPITLTGMTTGANDFGTASITGTGGDGSRAQFKVVRGASAPLSGNTISVSTTYNGYPIRGSLYYPTSSILDSSLDVLVLYHGTITASGVSPINAASTFINIVLNEVQIKDKIIFSVAYPQDIIPAWEANPSLPAQQFPGLDYSRLLFGDNIVYAEAALLWARDALNSFLSSNNVALTTRRLFTFGHSQGGYLVHQLNTRYRVDGIIANAPGPIDLLDRCSGQAQTNTLTCNKINLALGSVTTNPTAYNIRSAKNYVAGTLSPILYTQADDDDPYQVNLMKTVLQPRLEACTNCSTRTFRYYPTGGHDAFRVNTVLQQDIRNFVNSTIYSGNQGTTIRDFGIDNAQVRNGDQIILRTISSPNSLGQVSATFTVSGTDTNTVIAGVPGSTSDTWNVRSAERFCNITTFTLAETRDAIPGQTYSRSFVATGFDKDCGCTVTTSDTVNSFLRIGSRTGTTLSVSLGETVEIFMVAPYYDSTRSTTVTLASSFGTSRQAIYRIVPVAPPLPELTLDANPRNAPFIFPNGGSTTISYTYDYVTNATVTTNFGVSTVTTPRGSGSRSVSNILTTTTYTMTVSNSTGSTTRSVQVTVGDPPTPTASLCPSDTSTCASSTSIPYGGNITLFWKTQFATSITSNDFTTGNQQNGSVSLTNLTTDNKTYTITATGPGGTVNASHTVNLTPSVNLTADSENLINGQSTTLRWSSFLATSVVSASGFNAGGQVSGSLSVTPTTTTTYSITVADAEGNQISDTVRINVTDDRTPDSFSFNPPSFTGQQLNANVTSEPRFTNGGSSVSGLSPGVSVTASVSGTGAQFESGGTSKTVQNGTSTSELRVRLTNASTFGTTRTATLNVGGVTASFTSRTLDCTVRNGSGTVDNAITVNTRDTQSSGFLATGLSGGGGAISRGGGSSFDQTYGPGNSSLTLPAGTNRFYAAVIGGGGGAGSDDGCGSDAAAGGGGGGAAWGELTGNFGGLTVSISVGNGGNNTQNTSRGGKGGNTTVTVGGNTWRGEGGQGGGEPGPGEGGTNNTSPTNQTARGGSGSNTSGSGGKRGGGGGGAGQINGGTSAQGAQGCDSGPASGGQGGRGSSITGGSGDTGENGVCNSSNSCGNRNGGRGGNFGGGGGGGAQGASGGNGANGRARITYSVPAPPSETYFNLCREIMRAYWDKLNRAPSVSEIQTWVNNFKNNPTTYPNASSIYNAIQGTRFSGTLLDNCGQTFPRFP